MAVFERERSSRRFFSLSTDERPAHPGGIPGGSILTYVDTGDRFIFDNNEQVWYPFVGVEDSLSVLEEIQASNAEMALLLNDIQERLALAVG